MKEQIILNDLSIEDLKNLITEILSNELTKVLPEKPETIENPYMKTEEVAKLFNVSKITIGKWKNSGILQAYRISDKIYFKRTEVHTALKKIEIKGW